LISCGVRSSSPQIEVLMVQKAEKLREAEKLRILRSCLSLELGGSRAEKCLVVVWNEAVAHCKPFLAFRDQRGDGLESRVKLQSSSRERERAEVLCSLCIYSRTVAGPKSPLRSRRILADSFHRDESIFPQLGINFD